MTRTVTTKEAERLARLDDLRDLLPPGSTVHLILRHVSRSGMARWFDLYAPVTDGLRRITWTAAQAIERPYTERHEALRMDGCGMDMGFAAVYDLAQTLYPTGFGCTGPGCPSNDHSNGDRDYTPHLTMSSTTKADPSLTWNVMHDARGLPTGMVERDHWHSSGGYALNYRYL